MQSVFCSVFSKVGLAVDNIREVRDQAELIRKAIQVDHALDIERIVPEYFRQKRVTLKETILLNKPVSGIKKLVGLDSYKLTIVSIDKALNPEMDEMKNQKKTIRKMSYNMKEMNCKIDNLEGMLKAIYKNVEGEEWKEEDNNHYSSE